jgi:hypothetical protein
MRSTRPLSRSQTFSFLSELAEIARLPFGVIAMPVTLKECRSEVWPLSVLSRRPLSISQILSLPSPQAEMIRWPSGLDSTALAAGGTLQGSEFTPSLHVPHLERAVFRCRNASQSVRSCGDCVDMIGVVQGDARSGFGFKIPDLQCKVHGSGNCLAAIGA